MQILLIASTNICTSKWVQTLSVKGIAPEWPTIFLIVVSCTPASDRRDAGYKDVNQFMKAFEKSCRLLEEYQKASEDKTQDDPKEK